MRSPRERSALSSWPSRSPSVGPPAPAPRPPPAAGRAAAAPRTNRPRLSRPIGCAGAGVTAWRVARNSATARVMAAALSVSRRAALPPAPPVCGTAGARSSTGIWRSRRAAWAGCPVRAWRAGTACGFCGARAVSAPWRASRAIGWATSLNALTVGSASSRPAPRPGVAGTLARASGASRFSALSMPSTAWRIARTSSRMAAQSATALLRSMGSPTRNPCASCFSAIRAS